MQLRAAWAVSLVLFPLLLVAACAPDPVVTEEPYVPKENRVQLATQSQDLYFKPGTSAVDHQSSRMLDAFVATGGQPANVAISTSAPTTRLAVQRQANVKTALSRLGIASVARSTQPDPNVPRDAIRVTIARYVAVIPSCPDWSHPEGNSPGNNPTSNFGCANEVNLARMIANPADLLRGTTVTAGDATLAALRAREYQTGVFSQSLSKQSGGSSGGGSGGSGSGGGSGAGN